MEVLRNDDKPRCSMEENYVKPDADAIETLGHLGDQEQREETIWEALTRHPRTILWLCYAVLVITVVSYDNGSGSTALNIPRFREDYGSYYDGNYVLPARWQSAYSGGPTASSIVGSVGAGVFSDMLGRKLFFLVCYAIVLAGIALETFSYGSNAIFFAGKFVCGFAIGGLVTNSMAYIGEITPLALRGISTASAGLAFTIGPFIVTVLMNEYGSMDSPWAYRSIFVSQFGVTALAIIFLPFMPESPTWYVHHGKNEQALRSLRKLGQTPTEAEKSICIIKLTLEKARKETESASYTECFRKSNLRRTLVAVAPLSMQALCGVAFSAYGTYYMQLAGYSAKASFQLSLVGQGLALLGNIGSWFLIDRVGRRDLTLVGLLVMMVMLLVTGALAVQASPGAIKGTVALVLLFAFVYNISIGATGYTALTEIATSKLRAKTASLALIIQSALFTMWGFVLPYIFNPDKANLGGKTTFIFGSLSGVCFVVLFFFFPETRGRSYEELDEMFQKRIPTRQFKSYVTETQQCGTSNGA